jgi:chromosomal replication initiation ATPase DnaA
MMVTARTIIEDACMVWGVDEEHLRGPSRHLSVAWARQWAYCRLRDETPLSYPDIGRIFDRDHSTVVKGEQAFRRRLQNGEMTCPA